MGCTSTSLRRGRSLALLSNEELWKKGKTSVIILMQGIVLACLLNLCAANEMTLQRGNDMRKIRRNIKAGLARACNRRPKMHAKS